MVPKVYATGSKVVVYADPARLVQIVALPLDNETPDSDSLEPVTAVSGCMNSGQVSGERYTQHTQSSFNVTFLLDSLPLRVIIMLVYLDTRRLMMQ